MIRGHPATLKDRVQVHMLAFETSYPCCLFSLSPFVDPRWHMWALPGRRLHMHGNISEVLLASKM